MVTEAGRKLRAWRKSQKPPLSAHDAARWLGLSFMSVYRVETGTRPAGGKIMRSLLQREICAPGDFDIPASDEAA
ncbi:helix-turn-helix transcriptional regulator [Novosphingobium sp.]|uniref:helix-turn-helix domain-containing protein n=1 Tax=Novosphingobium sp. TaxID=1874826 RepID=UPI0031CF14EE